MTISLRDYEEFVMGLASPNSTKSFDAKLATGGLGLGGEAGEVADTIKKILFHEMEVTSEVRVKLLKELGDVLWYVAFTARTLDSDIQEIMGMNVAKLSERYSSGAFSKEEFMKKEDAKVD